MPNILIRKPIALLKAEAFAYLLKKRKQPVGFKAALKESVGKRPKKR